MTDDAHENDPETVWKLVKKIGTAMFITRDSGELEGRPLQGYPDRDAGVIFFMTDAEHLLAQVSADPRVLLSFAGTGSNDYVAIDGTVTISHGRAKIKDLWTVWAKAFWDSPDDPKIRVLIFNPGHARYWDAPNQLVSALTMVANVVAGTKPKLGKAGDVTL